MSPQFLALPIAIKLAPTILRRRGQLRDPGAALHKLFQQWRSRDDLLWERACSRLLRSAGS